MKYCQKGKIDLDHNTTTQRRVYKILKTIKELKQNFTFHQNDTHNENKLSKSQKNHTSCSINSHCISEKQ